MAGVYACTSEVVSGTLVYKLEQFDPTSLSLIATLDETYDVAVVDGNVWVLKGAPIYSGDLYRVDRDDVSNVLSTVSTTLSSGITSSNGRLYAMDESGTSTTDQLARLDPTDGSVIWQVAGTICGSNPRAVVDDGTYAYVVNADSSLEVRQLNADDGSFVDYVTLSGLAGTRATIIGSNLFVRQADGKVAKIDTSTMTVTTTFLSSDAPTDLTTDGTDLFVTGGLFSTVHIKQFDPATVTETDDVISTNLGGFITFDTDLYTVNTLGRVSRTTVDPLTFDSFASTFGTTPLEIAVLYANPALSGIFVGAVVF